MTQFCEFFNGFVLSNKLYEDLLVKIFLIPKRSTKSLVSKLNDPIVWIEKMDFEIQKRSRKVRDQYENSDGRKWHGGPQIVQNLPNY